MVFLHITLVRIKLPLNPHSHTISIEFHIKSVNAPAVLYIMEFVEFFGAVFLDSQASYVPIFVFVIKGRKSEMNAFLLCSSSLTEASSSSSDWITIATFSFGLWPVMELLLVYFNFFLGL
jgi:nitrate reductase NapE component